MPLPIVGAGGRPIVGVGGLPVSAAGGGGGEEEPAGDGHQIAAWDESTSVTRAARNDGATTLAAGTADFGQAFPPGYIPTGEYISATIGGGAATVQADVKNRWDDGSVRFAKIHYSRASLASGASHTLTFAATATPPASAVNLATVLSGHTITVELTSIAANGASRSNITVDLTALVTTALAGSPDYWCQGPLCTSIRVAQEISSTSLRVVADVFGYAGGAFGADVQICNDRAMEASATPGPGPVTMTTTMKIDGVSKYSKSALYQQQYANWRRRICSTDVDGGLGLGSAAAGWLNILPMSVDYLYRTGYTPKIPTDWVAPSATLAAYATAYGGAGWGEPLATNGHAPYMPDAGDRPELGFFSWPGVYYLLGGDMRAAKYMMGWAEIDGHVPWNFWDSVGAQPLNNGRWPKVWTGATANGTPGGFSVQSGMTQAITNVGDPWTQESAHQPDVSSIPYMLTGDRWIYDHVLSRGLLQLIWNWWGFGSISPPHQIERINPYNGEYELCTGDFAEQRAAAWSIKHMEQAWWMIQDTDTTFKTYLRTKCDANYTWLVNRITDKYNPVQGERSGYFMNKWNGGLDAIGYQLPAWQGGYWVVTMTTVARRGISGALDILEWMYNYQVGRFIQTDFYIRDALGPRLYIAASAADLGELNPGGEVFATWAETETYVLAHLSNESSHRNWPSGWNENFTNLGRHGLSVCGMYHYFYETLDPAKSAEALVAYDNIRATGNPWLAKTEFESAMTIPVAIVGEYGTL